MPRIKYTKELLEEIVSHNFSIGQVLDELGLYRSGGNHSHIKKKIDDYQIDISHFTGQGWRRNRSFGYKKPVEFYLVKNCPIVIKSHDLKIRLIDEGVFPHQCNICKLETWLGENIPLELHHINSDHYDNRLENLQILCPNCHTLIT